MSTVNVGMLKMDITEMPVNNNGNTTEKFRAEISIFKKLGVITETQADGSGFVFSIFL